jgi:hypothetical protein
MAMPEIVDIDPRSLHLPSSRLSGADPVKLHSQMARFGSSMAGMPPALPYRGPDGAIKLYDGVTRATRVARLLPSQTIRIEAMRTIAKPFGHLPLLGDTLPLPTPN